MYGNLILSSVYITAALHVLLFLYKQFTNILTKPTLFLVRKHA